MCSPICITGLAEAAEVVGKSWDDMSLVYLLLGKVDRASSADAVEVWCAPMAVRMVVGGAPMLWWRTGAVGIK